MQPDRRRLATSIFNFAKDCLSATVSTQDDAAEFKMALEDVATYAAHFLSADRDNGRSCEELDAALFEQLLEGSGLDGGQRAKARNVRTSVLFLARQMLEGLGTERGDDPPGCDPGGGMGHPDERDRNGPA